MPKSRALLMIGSAIVGVTLTTVFLMDGTPLLHRAVGTAVALVAICSTVIYKMRKQPTPSEERPNQAFQWWVLVVSAIVLIMSWLIT